MADDLQFDYIVYLDHRISLYSNHMITGALKIVPEVDAFKQRRNIDFTISIPHHLN